MTQTYNQMKTSEDSEWQKKFDELDLERNTNKIKSINETACIELSPDEQSIILNLLDDQIECLNQCLVSELEKCRKSGLSAAEARKANKMDICQIQELELLQYRIYRLQHINGGYTFPWLYTYNNTEENN